MLKNNKTIRVCILLGSLCLSHLSVAMPNIVLGSAKVLPGNLVEVPLSLTNDGQVSAVQMDIQYDTSQLSLGVPVIDGALNADFSVLSHEIINGKMRVLIIPISNNPVISSGDVIHLPFTLTADATVITGYFLLSLHG